MNFPKDRHAHFKHGQAAGHRMGRKTPEYMAWSAAKNRCTNPNNGSWKDYGGRGISMCPDWINDFEAFFAIVGKRPSTSHQLDRHPNNDGNYEPGNVRWATRRQQQRNRRNNRIIEVAGERVRLIDAAELYSKPRYLVLSRIKRGWTPERALGLVV